MTLDGAVSDKAVGAGVVVALDGVESPVSPLRLGCDGSVATSCLDRSITTNAVVESSREVVRQRKNAKNILFAAVALCILIVFD